MIMRLFGTAALIVVALAASQCAAQSVERASIQLSRVEPQQGSLRERKLPRDKKHKHHHDHHQQETQTEGTPIPPEEYYDKQTRQQQPSCSVCGDGMKVGNPDASVSFPGQAGQIPCGVLQNMGTVGLIPPPQCAVLPQLISTICECESTTPPTTTVAPITSTEATKPHSGKASKSTQQSHSMSVPSKAGKSIHGKSTSPHSDSGKSNKKTVITTKTYKSSSSKGSKMIASKASNKSKTSSKGEKSASKSSKSSGTVDAKAEKVSSSKGAKSAVPKAAKSARA